MIEKKNARTAATVTSANTKTIHMDCTASDSKMQALCGKISHGRIAMSNEELSQRIKAGERYLLPALWEQVCSLVLLFMMYLLNVKR